MRKPDYLVFGIAAATLCYVAAAPGVAGAQDEGLEDTMPTDPAPPTEASPEEAPPEIADWPPEKQAAYQAWPEETKSYYWTLTPERQNLFWALADSDKIALTAMTGPEREEAWEQIESRAGAMSS